MLGTEVLPSCAPHVEEAVEGTVRDEASEGGGTVAAHWLPTRPPSTGAAASMIVLRGCTGGGLPARVPCYECTEWMYWGRRTGLPAMEPCRVRALWVASVWGGGPTRASPSCPLVAPRGRREDANPSR